MTVGTTCHHGSFFRGRGTWSNRSGCEMPKVEILPRNLGEGLDKMDDLGKCYGPYSSKHLLRLYLELFFGVYINKEKTTEFLMFMFIFTIYITMVYSDV